MRDIPRTLLCALVAATACTAAPSRLSSRSSAPAAPRLETVSAPIAVTCTDCTSGKIDADIRGALVARIADLQQRGGTCAAYGDVLDRSLAADRITIKPYMWRVGRNLASGEGRSNGEMTLARDIDSLNVGLRSLDDVVKSIEHEAAHIALGVPSGVHVNEERIDGVVHSCRAGAS